NTLNPYRF
ncbi:hypothetical protein D047_0678B, partial [Vibrio parahaemolyticus VPTS-2010_2]